MRPMGVVLPSASRSFLAQAGPYRYGELRRTVRDVSDKMLIQQLKELEADGLVKRTD